MAKNDSSAMRPGVANPVHFTDTALPHTTPIHTSHAYQAKRVSSLSGSVAWCRGVKAYSVPNRALKASVASTCRFSRSHHTIADSSAAAHLREHAPSDGARGSVGGTARRSPCFLTRTSAARP